MEETLKSNLTRYLVKSAKGREEAQTLLNQMDAQGYKPILMSVHDLMPMSDERSYHFTFEIK